MPALRATVQVPATSANLGPGFDSLGLALDLLDDVTVTVLPSSGVQVEVTGEGAGEVPTGEDHLVVRALRATLTQLEHPQPDGLHLACVNRVPHGRGLGSSAAAVVAGVLLGRALAGAPTSDAQDSALAGATRFEGHPDNAAAALLGGATIAWSQRDEHAGEGPRAVRLDVHGDLVPLVLLPPGRLATHHARAVLPASVTHEDAAFNVARTALLVHALTRAPELLFAATQDRLHQRQRRTAMPASLAIIEQLRANKVAAVVSGAGPAVLVLSTRSRQDADRELLAQVHDPALTPPWQLLSPGVRLVPSVATVTESMVETRM